MIKQVTCKCGKELVLHFDKATTVVVKATFSDYKVVHSWRCDNCGQEYIKEADKPIYL